MSLSRWILVVLMIGAVGLPACTRTTAGPAHTDEPAHVEAIAGSELHRLTLIPKAAERLGIQTGPVREEQAPGSRTKRKVVPYSAVIYDSHGDTWVYTSPENLVYVRAHIKVERIDGDKAILSEGPPAGTQVVTVGGALLFGTEFEVGH
jgi:hypothetical protein